MIYQGYHWPDGDTAAHRVIMSDVLTAMPAFLEEVTGRTCVIQAGGNVGVYPNALGVLFDHVVTFEPDKENFRCMMMNLDGHIQARFAALGEKESRCGTQVVAAGNCGAHRLDLQKQDVPVLTIDSLDLIPDAIWLDIEGFEYFALKGAEQTLKEHSPVVVIEEKGLGETYGVRPGDCSAFLRNMGYSEVGKIGRDVVYRKTA
jgi:FkbM family methyltransferase